MSKALPTSRGSVLALWRRRPHFRVPSAETAMVTGACEPTTTAGDEVMAHVQTYGERIQELEAERQRYRSALLDALGWISIDQPEHLRISRLLGSPPEVGPFRFRDNARRGQR